MPLTELDNLVRIGELYKEPPDVREINGLITSAKQRLADVENVVLSNASKFDLTYNAAHALALAALRFHGYRSPSRYQVFQCLHHTLNLTQEKTRIFVLCHEKRNKAEYEGFIDIEAILLGEYSALASELLVSVEACVGQDE